MDTVGYGVNGTWPYIHKIKSEGHINKQRKRDSQEHEAPLGESRLFLCGAFTVTQTKYSMLHNGGTTSS